MAVKSTIDLLKANNAYKKYNEYYALWKKLKDKKFIVIAEMTENDCSPVKASEIMTPDDLKIIRAAITRAVSNGLAKTYDELVNYGVSDAPKPYDVYDGGDEDITLAKAKNIKVGHTLQFSFKYCNLDAELETTMFPEGETIKDLVILPYTGYVMGAVADSESSRKDIYFVKKEDWLKANKTRNHELLKDMEVSYAKPSLIRAEDGSFISIGDFRLNEDTVIVCDAIASEVLEDADDTKSTDTP